MTKKPFQEAISYDHAHPIMIPPLVTFDGKRHRIQWLSKPADVPLEFSFNLGYEFSNDQHEIWYEKGASYFAEPELQKRLIAEIRQRAGAPAEATFEELIKSNKARNLWWISAYATATKIKFTGIPIEQAASVRYTHKGDQKFLSTSLILDFPEEELRKLWIAPPRLNTDFASLPQSVPGFIKLIAEPPPATEMVEVFCTTVINEAASPSEKVSQDRIVVSLYSCPHFLAIVYSLLSIMSLLGSSTIKWKCSPRIALAV